METEVRHTGNVVIGGNPENGDAVIRDVYTDREGNEMFIGVEVKGMLCISPLEEFTDEMVAVSIVPKWDEQFIDACCKAAERAALRALANA